MKLEQIRKIIGGILLVSLLLIGFYKPVQQYFQLPKHLTLFEGQKYSYAKAAPVTAAVSSYKNITVGQNEHNLSIEANKPGEEEVLLEVAGLPIKKVDVNVLKNFKVIPGGQSIGVKLNTVGVLVVGHHQIDTIEGKASPGETAGVKIGDIITEINGKQIDKMTELTPVVQTAGEAGETLKLSIQRDKEKIFTQLKPLKDKIENTYKLGLYIRDSAQGIGTMTFYHPETKKYGALGHVISDMDTKKPIIVDDGEIVRSTVTSIEKGSNGDPGEKLARFSNDHEVIGNIKRNSPYGIFGELNRNIDNQILNKPLPVALSHQVKEGPAKILTVVNNDKVESFDIEIVSTIPQKFPATKGMVIKVTDPVLLEKTGGIVQGMSGSPIIQNNKVVGAVTHVFVNDPTSGYGVHIEWMLNEAGINIYEKGEAKAS